MSILNAAYEGNLARVRQLYNEGASLDEQIPETGATALLYATQQEKIGVMRFLIENKADVNAQLSAYQKSTALHFAVSLANPDAVRLLIQGGADVTIKDTLGRDPYSLGRAMVKARNTAARKEIFSSLKAGAEVQLAKLQRKLEQLKIQQQATSQERVLADEEKSDTFSRVQGGNGSQDNPNLEDLREAIESAERALKSAIDDLEIYEQHIRSGKPITNGIWLADYDKAKKEVQGRREKLAELRQDYQEAQSQFQPNWYSPYLAARSQPTYRPKKPIRYITMFEKGRVRLAHEPYDAVFELHTQKWMRGKELADLGKEYTVIQVAWDQSKQMYYQYTSGGKKYVTKF